MNPFDGEFNVFPTISDLINNCEKVVKEQGFDERLQNDYIGSIKARLLSKHLPGDNPDELAMKAQKSDKKPEDFDSVEAYIKYLHEEIELPEEEKEELEKMDEKIE